MNRYLRWALLLVLLISFMTIQCSIEKPVAPTWNLTLSVPLINEHYDMAILIDKMDEPYLKVDSLGNPLFYFEEKLDTTRLIDRLRCDSTSVGFKDTLGVRTINTSESKEILLYVTDFYQGEPGYVPPCSVTIQEDFDPFSNFTQVTAQKAFSTLTISNHLGLNLTRVEVKIIDRGLQDTIHSEIISSGIPNGDSAVQNILLTDVTFSNQLSIQVKGISPGGQVDSFEGKYLLVSFSVDSMIVVEGTAKLKAFEISQEDKIQLPTKSIIDSARIKTGRLSLHLHNYTKLDADVYIDFPELEKDGEILSTINGLPASDSCYLTLILDGYEFKPVEGNETKVQTRISSPGSDGIVIDFSATDSVTVDANLAEIIFSQVSGIIEPTKVQIEEIQRQLDIPPGFESACLTGASLSLDIHNGVNLPAQLSVDIEGEGGQNLNLQTEVEASGPFGTAVTSVSEEDLESLLSPVPQRITLTGEITYGDGESIGNVREEDFLFGEVMVSSPLELIWDSCQVQIDPDSDQVDDDVREMIEEQINFARVVLKVESHLPVEGEVKIFFSRNQEDLFSDPDLVIGPINVPKGKLSLDGSVREAENSETKIEMTNQDFLVFTDIPFHMTGTINFPGTDGRKVKASASDYIRITSYLELNVKNKRD
jgi:hypothetical protein